MTAPIAYPIGSVTVLDIVGADAVKIAQNLTTNDVNALPVGQGCETFVTDVRGKALGHVIAFRLVDRLRLIGAPGQADAISEHFDRYTIREDAVPTDRSQEWDAWPIADADSLSIDFESSDTFGSIKLELGAQQSDVSDSDQINAYQVPWVDGGVVVLVRSQQTDDLRSWLAERGIEESDDSAFHRRRVGDNFPWYGVDVDASNLPQEASRDGLAISFTKGCYLGQETVARLDALGQVQKKLVRWTLRGNVPAAGAKLESDGKVVGRLTSVATPADGEDDRAMAIGFARRSHFDPGSAAEGDGFRGEVVA